MTDGYNGWTNRATWNVALWIGNDEGLYRLARTCRDYDQFVEQVRGLGMAETPDGVAWEDSSLDIDELDAMIVELTS